MSKAAGFTANSAVREGVMSFSHASAVTDAFRQFSTFAKEHGVKQLEHVTPALVTAYGQQLADRVNNDDSDKKIGPGHAQNSISAINTIMRLATAGEWRSVSPTKNCGIVERSAIRETPPTGLDREQMKNGLNALDERGKAIAGLARELGLRSKEASLLNAKSAFQAAQNGSIRISDGTKGGRPRDIPISRERQEQQIAALERAAAVQGNAKAVMPASENWKSWSQNGLREIRETLQSHGVSRLHDLRSSYACDRYQQITGHAAPVLGGNAPRNEDRAARLKIARELGHNRTEITNAYIGAHK